jgi:hypothetical protein
LTTTLIDPSYKRKNQAKIEQEEKELEDLLSGKAQEEPEVKEEPKAEDKPLNREEESFKKRYGDLRRYSQEQEKRLQEKIDALEARLNSSTATNLPTSEEDLEAWITKHPDVAAIVQAMAAREAEKRVKGTEEKLRQIDEDRYELTRQKAEQAIREAHSDFDSIKTSDDFHDWAEEQPKWVQDAIYENSDDARSVIRVIDLYKVDKGLTKAAKKQQDREAAAFVKAKGKTNLDDDTGAAVYSESKVAKMSNKEYEQHEAKILEAMRTGTFKYDLSGGAR